MWVARLLMKAASAGLALAMVAALPSIALGQTNDKDTQKTVVVDSGIDFGDDTSRWANDGECDDPRFTGPAADENLQDVDRGHDATDCRAAYEAGNLTLAQSGGEIDFGDDTSQYANDGECDDPRFTGSGAAANNLEADKGHDATDCRTAYDAGTVTFAGDAGGSTGTAAIDFGDDTSQYANDNECDDPRFTGTGANPNNLEADKGHDATDCRAAYEAGTVTDAETTGTGTGGVAGEIDYGDDTSAWANDGECDDPRFVGAGSTSSKSDEDRGHDATDCRAAVEAGSVTYAGETGTGTDTGMGTPISTGDIHFGDDTSQYANDNECDDPRFTGTGANANNLEADKGHDATDCRAAYEAGTVTYSGETGTTTTTTTTTGDIDFGDDSSQYANDNECDDPRFTGTGANANNLEADKGHDATDCRAAYEAGTVTYNGETGGAIDTGTTTGPGPNPGGDVDFGDDASQYAKDGECDDPRFTGPGAAANNVEADLGHDATDCRTAYEEGRISLADPGNDADDSARIDFGDDTSQYAKDGECDDPRFAGTGANANNLEADRGHDATDCRAAYEAGTIVLQQATGEDTSETPTPTDETEGTKTEPDTGTDNQTETTPDTGTETTSETTSGIDFGANDGQWTNDGQCDDPRFEGSAAATEQVEADLMHDADDCRAAFQAGTVTLREGAGSPTDTTGGNTETTPADNGTSTGDTATPMKTTPGNTSSIDYGDDSGAWANDGDCDDPRFSGAGVADFVVSVDIAKDAADCRKAVEAGTASIKPVFGADYVSGAPYSEEGIDFGDNTSNYSSNDQCDDPRFEGPGMAAAMLASDTMHDSVDCRAAFIAGTIALKAE